MVSGLVVRYICLSDGGDGENESKVAKEREGNLSWFCGEHSGMRTRPGEGGQGWMGELSARVSCEEMGVVSIGHIIHDGHEAMRTSAGPGRTGEHNQREHANEGRRERGNSEETHKRDTTTPHGVAPVTVCSEL